MAQASIEQPVAAAGEALLNRNIERRAFALLQLIAVFLMNPDPANARLVAAAAMQQGTARRRLARAATSRDHRADAAHTETAIDEKTEHAVLSELRAPVFRLQQLVQETGQAVDAAAVEIGDRKHRRSGEPAAGEQFAHFGLDLVQPGLAGSINLGERDATRADIEQVEYCRMLDGLGHDAVVRGDDEQGGVDRAHAGEHVADEVDMPRNVYEAKQTIVSVRFISLVGEAEIDRQAPFFLLRKRVGIDSGQIAHEQGLAMIDMTRGGNRQRAQSQAVCRL